MANKDPAFLFYPQRWLEGTAEFSPAERGIYIDLLAYQHQKGSIPNDSSKLCRLVRLSEQEFLPIWEGVKIKFIETKDNRLVNRTLDQIKTERSTKSIKNKITGILASLIRLSDQPHEVKEKIKKEFKIDAFLTVPEGNLTDRLGEWFQERLKSIINGNGNINTLESNLKKGEPAKRFSENGKGVYFEDGIFQPFGFEQKIAFDKKEINPRDVKRGLIY